MFVCEVLFYLCKDIDLLGSPKVIIPHVKIQVFVFVCEVSYTCVRICPNFYGTPNSILYGMGVEACCFVIGTVLVVSLGNVVLCLSSYCFTCVRESWGSDGEGDCLSLECACVQYFLLFTNCV